MNVSVLILRLGALILRIKQKNLKRKIQQIRYMQFNSIALCEKKTYLLIGEINPATVK